MSAEPTTAPVPMTLTWNTTNREQVGDRISEQHTRISEGYARAQLAVLNSLINDYEPHELLAVEVVITHRTGYTAITGHVPPKE